LWWYGRRDFFAEAMVASFKPDALLHVATFGIQIGNIPVFTVTVALSLAR